MIEASPARDIAEELVSGGDQFVRPRTHWGRTAVADTAAAPAPAADIAAAAPVCAEAGTVQHINAASVTAAKRETKVMKLPLASKFRPPP